MIKVSVLYPNVAGARFDHTYYRDIHLPLVQELLGDAVKFYTIEKGLSGIDAKSAPTYIGMCHLFSESAEIYRAAMDRHGKQILADIANYTEIVPVIQFSDVVVGYTDLAHR